MGHENNGNRTENIRFLEELASQILELKSIAQKQRRPIVIEFCGSPKSGKTSSINSLNIFLKRNGFNTIILTERASICPISNKQDPIFNVWTCTSSINEINKTIDANRFNRGGDEDIDIIICDRGIFDAICWFRWLKDTNKMLDAEYEIMTKFAMLHRWKRNIDLVYTFISDPEKSIEREYANLLTNKAGSIMNTKILSEYRQAILDTRKDYGAQFREVKEIDTSNKAQNQVGFEVTKSTLETLKDMLMEKVGYALKNDLSLDVGINKTEPIIQSLDRCLSFESREKVENVEAFIQPIPIAVIANKERTKVLCLKKTSKSTTKDSAERNKFLFYAGGHMRKEDNTPDTKEKFINIAKNTLNRELYEELGLSEKIDGDPIVIYTPTTAKSSRHLAICWIIELDADNCRILLDPYEMVQRKGSSKSGTFISIENINDDTFQTEDWSKHILSHYFDKELKGKSDNQMSLFNND